MLIDLVEWERTAGGPGMPPAWAEAAGPVRPALGEVDYLFVGRAPMAPRFWLAGGVLGGGQPVSGAGLDLAAALGALAGECAEAALFSRAEPDGGSGVVPPSTGLGAHPSLEGAVAHGALERIERQVVLAWWRHGGPARQIDAAAGVDLLGPDRARRSAFLLLGEPGEVATVVAVSFEPDGRGFCFGAAARPSLATAVQSAAKELVQAEFGLEIARMKMGRYGQERLGRNDNLALHLARAVPPEMVWDGTVRTLGLDGFGSADAAYRPADRVRWKSLGRYNDCLEVVKVLPAGVKEPEDCGVHSLMNGLTERASIPLY